MANEAQFDYSVYADSQEPQPSPVAPQAAANVDFDYSQYADKPEPLVSQSAKDRILSRIKESRLEQARQTAISGMRGLTLGVSDTLGAAGTAAGYKVAESAGLVPESNQTMGEIYNESRGKIAAERDAFRDEQPALAYGAEIGGAMAPILLSGGAIAPAVATKGTASLIGKGAAIGAGQGGLYGATQADVGNVGSDALKGAGIGLALGGAVPAVIKGGGAIRNAYMKADDTMAAEKAMESAGKAIGSVGDDAIEALRSRGIDFEKLPDDIKSKVAQYSGMAKEAGESIRPDDVTSIVNQSKLNKMPIPGRGTKGELSGDYLQQRREAIIASSPVGGMLRNKLVEENTNALSDNLDMLARKTGGDVDMSVDAVGNQLSGLVERRAAKSLDDVRANYKAAEATEGGRVVDVSRELTDWFRDNSALKGADALKQSAEKIGALKGVADGEMMLTPEMTMVAANKGVPLKNLNDLRKSASKMMKNPETMEAGKEVKKIVDRVVGEQGGELYRKAISSRKAHGDIYERGPAILKDLLSSKGKSATDKMLVEKDAFDRAIVRGKKRDVDHLFSYLAEKGDFEKEGAEITNNLRQQAMARIADAAGGGDKKYTADRLRKAINSIGGPEKLESIFGKEGKQMLDDFQAGANVYLKKAPSALAGSQTSSNASIMMGDILGALSSLVPAGQFTKTIAGNALGSGLSKNALAQDDKLLIKFISKERQARNAAANKAAVNADEAIRGGQRTLTSDNN